MRSPVLLLACAALALVLALPASASAAARCDLVAAPWGSDAAEGSVAAPLATAQALVRRLRAGQRGCLRAGTYRDSLSIRAGGERGRRLVLASYPGERATIRGRIVVFDSADWVTLEDLVLDGRNRARLPSPTINGDHVLVRDSDVTNRRTAICFIIGSAGRWGRARHTRIEHNRIHDCGRRPANNHEHGIYAEAADRAVIARNLIYDNADRGVQLYPSPRGVTVAHNIIADNGQGVIFGSVSRRLYARDNRVRGNVIAYARLRHNLESWWGGRVGVANRASGNCLWGAAGQNVDRSAGGFSAVGNLVADPRFADRARRDYRMPPSACRALLGEDLAASFAPVAGRR